MSSQYTDDIPEDIKSLLFSCNNDDGIETSLDLLENMNTTVTHNPEYQRVPEVQLNSPTYYPQNPMITPNYNTVDINYTYNNSPLQSNSEYSYGDGSEMVAQSPYISQSGLLSPSSYYSNTPSPQSSVYSEYSVQQPSNQGSSDETIKQISINIQEGTKHKYRHAKEMKIGHGGIKGEIMLPMDYKTSDYRIILSALPSEESKQKIQIHPCMLHVTVMNQGSKQKRAKYRTQLAYPQDWRVVLDIEQGKVFYIPNYGQLNERYEIDCVRNGQMILGGNNLQVKFQHYIICPK